MFPDLQRRLLDPAVFPRRDEERSILDFFNGYTGVFVDVGANHPVTGSQTYALEQRGWSGLLIEPLPDYAALLSRQRRARVVPVACGCPQQEGEETLLGEAGGLSTTVADRIESEVIFTSVRTVPMFTLDAILSNAGIDAVDFVSIDVEGRELDVLRGFDLGRRAPALILIEDHIEDSSIHRLLAARGYKRVRRTGDNSWYVPQARDFPVSLFGRWQLLRKYYLARPLRRLRAAGHRRKREGRR